MSSLGLSWVWIHRTRSIDSYRFLSSNHLSDRLYLALSQTGHRCPEGDQRPETWLLPADRWRSRGPNGGRDTALSGEERRERESI